MANNYHTVLIVDDDIEFNQLVTCNLKNDGFRVFQAFNGIEAVDLAKKKQPSVILLDIMMPVMDGHDVLRELKADKKTKDLPVFMFSAKSLMKDVEEAISTGADDYISKATEPDDLGRVIRAKLENVIQEANAQS
ncbi:MAG: response regulator [Planctomycetes bacterium]|nr:response regulator [Planctomycetota bacterium]